MKCQLEIVIPLIEVKSRFVSFVILCLGLLDEVVCFIFFTCSADLFVYCNKPQLYEMAAILGPPMYRRPCV